MPLPRWEVTPPGDMFRVFERGGRVIGTQFPDIGDPNATGELQKLDEPGRPDFHASNRDMRHRIAHRGAADQHHQDPA